MAYTELTAVLINEDTDDPIKVTLLRDSKGDKIDIRHMYWDDGELAYTKRGIRMPAESARDVRDVMEDILSMMED